MSEKIQVGHLSTAYHTSFLLMGDKKSSINSDLEISWFQFSTGPEMIKALKQSKLDAVYIGIPPGIIGIDKGVPMKCVASGHIEGTIMMGLEHAFPLSNFEGDFFSFFQQFHNQTIGVTRKGSIHDVILRKYLDKYKGKSSIKIKNYNEAELIAYDVYKKHIIAGVGTPALLTFASSFTKSHLLVPPYRFWSYNPSYGIFFHQKKISSSPDQVVSFLKAHKKASELLRLNPDKAAEIISRNYQIFSKKYVKQVIGISPRYCIAISPKFLQVTMNFTEYLQKIGYINKMYSKNEIFNLKFIEEVHPEQEHFYNP